MEEQGCNILDVICTHKIKNQDGIRYIAKEKDKINLLKSTQNAIIFADDTFLKFADSSNVKIKIENTNEQICNLKWQKLPKRKVL